jgi:Ca2+-binding RTX toxin-like protein
MATVSTNIQDIDQFQEDLDIFNLAGNTAVEDSLDQFASSLSEVVNALSYGTYSLTYSSYSQVIGSTNSGGDFELQGANLPNLQSQPATLTYLYYGDNAPAGEIWLRGSVNTSASGIGGSLTEIIYQSAALDLHMQGKMSFATGAGSLTELSIAVHGDHEVSMEYRGTFRVSAAGDISGNANYLLFQVDGDSFEVSGLRASFVNLDNLIDLSSAGSVLTYILSGNDTITGSVDGQTLYGYAGNDALITGGADATLIGGLGNDIYRLSAAASIVELAGQGNDKVESSVSHELDENVENLLLTGSTDIDGTGNELKNTIIGNGGANVLDGADGMDTLKGALGDDTYVVDLLLSGTRVKLEDKLTELAGEGTDTLALRTEEDLGLAAPATLTLGANLENLDASGTGANKLNLTGNAANNTITGNAGDNVLKGGGGSDSFTGGAGVDRFIIDRVTSLVAQISDFEAGTDMLGLGQKSYAALFSNGVLKDGAFANGAAATTATQRLFYDAGTGGLYYDSDGSGAAVAVQVATLTNTPASLAASDFVLALGS